MLSPQWLLETPIEAILFDCDNTLSHIEGIDELAEKNGVADSVKQMTADAMTHTGLTLDIYRKRLQLTRPTQQQLNWLGKYYIQHVTEDARAVIQIFQKFKKAIYILSAGLRPSVIMLGEYLNVSVENIFAVDIYFDQQGKYINFDENSVLVENIGKKSIVQKIKQQYAYLGYCGDGLNDCSVMSFVTRFIGYGGACYRKNIAEMCEYYLTQHSLTGLLPLFLTKKESEQLNFSEQKLYQKGLLAIEKI